MTPFDNFISNNFSYDDTRRNRQLEKCWNAAIQTVLFMAEGRKNQRVRLGKVRKLLSNRLSLVAPEPAANYQTPSVVAVNPLPPQLSIDEINAKLTPAQKEQVRNARKGKTYSPDNIAAIKELRTILTVALKEALDYVKTLDLPAPVTIAEIDAACSRETKEKALQEMQLGLKIQAIKLVREGCNPPPDLFAAKRYVESLELSPVAANPR
jgi:ribosomal protein L7/L12